MKLLYIHGANASGASWNYVRERVPGPDVVLEYSSVSSFYSNLKSMRKAIGKEKLFIIGHSLGGIYALHLSKQLGEQCLGAISISTPIGGSSLADLARLLIPWFKLFGDVGVCSKPVVEAQEIARELTIPWTQVVTTAGGVPYVPDQNDGVVSIISQTMHSNRMTVVKMPSNHYEVLQEPRLVKLINTAINQLATS